MGRAVCDLCNFHIFFWELILGPNTFCCSPKALYLVVVFPLLAPFPSEHEFVSLSHLHYRYSTIRSAIK